MKKIPFYLIINIKIYFVLGFFESFVKNIQDEYSKSKEMKDSLEKFREEAKKLEESDALKEARRKFQNIEGESSKSSNVLK